MNQQPQSKVCPRCRFMLSKTYSQKMICKRCGYTTNKLQIVAEEDTFNTNIKFSKRVTIKPDKVVQQQAKTQDNLQTYLKTYQSILKHLGTKFIASDIKESIASRQKATQTFKNLWFGYLQKMSKQGNPIAGIFTALMEKEDRKQQHKSKVTSKPQKQEQSDQASSGDEDQKKSQQQNQKDEQSNKRSLDQDEQKPNTKKKLSLPKDQTMREYKKIVNSTLKSIKAIKDNSYNKFRQTYQKQLLQKLLSLPRDKVIQSSFSSLTYLSDRYCWILGLGQCFRNKNKKKSKQSLQMRMEMKYVRQDELRELCRQRGMGYQKRRLYGELSILCYDMLEYWYRRQNKISVSMIGENNHYPYGYLLQTYKQSPTKPQLIQQLMKVLQTMSQQVLIKQQQNAKKLPQLSLKFICALIYLSNIINQNTFTLLQVINFTVQQLYQYAQQCGSSQDKVRQEMLCLLIKEKNLKVKRVKKISHQLFNYLSQYLNNVPLCLNKWCNKYAKLFNLPTLISKQLFILTKTLYNSYIQESSLHNSVSTIINGNNLVNNFSERFIVLQQPQIVLSTLIIYIKLNFGLDKSQYPYLVNIGQVWKQILKDKQYFNEKQQQKVQFVSKLLQQQQQLFNINSSNGESQFGLIKLLHHINISYQPINHINQLKYISNKQIKTLTNKIHQFKSIITKKQQSYLSLVYNLNLKNNPQQIKKKNNLPILIKYIQKQQQQQQKQQRQQQMMKEVNNKNTKKDKYNNNKNDVLLKPQLFLNTRLQTKITLNPNLYRAIDFLQDKYNRFYQYKKKKNQQNQPNRSNINKNNNYVQQKIVEQQQQQHSNNSVQNNKNKQQFVIEQYLDRPMAHYQIVYHPTINNLNQLQLKQLLTIVQSLSLNLNGQYTDCTDILQWLGFLESVLKEFQN